MRTLIDEVTMATTSPDRSRNRPRALCALAVAATAACASQPQEETLPPRRLSATEHQDEALRHDREARERDSARTPRGKPEAGAGQSEYGCYGDGREMPEPTSGGERVPVLRPCWTAATEGSSENEKDAAAHRREAARHRSMAAALWRAEKRACAGLGQADIEQSPFFHREDIARVEPLRSGSQVRGAVVVFRAVRGLSADWMRKAVSCHEARAAALGYPPQHMSYCPLMAAPTSATVVLNGAEITVTITAQRDEDAAAVLARAQALVGR
jgi:hypothetical protein